MTQLVKWKFSTYDEKIDPRTKKRTMEHLKNLLVSQWEPLEASRLALNIPTGGENQPEVALYPQEPKTHEVMNNNSSI
jgi:hypothetical protein